MPARQCSLALLAVTLEIPVETGVIAAAGASTDSMSFLAISKLERQISAKRRFTTSSAVSARVA